MKKLTLVLPLLALPLLAHAEDVWRWQDAQGTVHYSNVPGLAPANAEAVKTRITIEADRLPGAAPRLAMADGDVAQAADRAPAPRARTERSSKWLPGPPKIYDEARLRFGCAAGGVLYNGGFSHPDDIAAGYDCSPYRIGPQAWLNSARAELALRENGISTLEFMQFYGERTKGD